MRLRELAVGAALTLTCSAAVRAQGPPALSSAEEALRDVVARHDRAGFERLLAPDAVFLIPIATHGTDAIVRVWMPYLVPGMGTITLTPREATTAAAGDIGYGFGAFSVSTPMTTVTQNGEYLSVWRLIDGAWKIVALSGGPTRLVTGGVGGYRFGMRPDDVRQVSECAPYTPVAMTGGLECANYTFEGRRMNISFIFAGSALQRVQLWFYEGDSAAEARAAIDQVLEYLRRVGGAVAAQGLTPGVVNSERVLAALDAGRLDVGQRTQVELFTQATAAAERWFARVGKFGMPGGQGGYAVMLLAEPRPAR